MTFYVELAILLVLTFVALELRLLRNDLARLPLLLLRQAEDKKDSPIVNVNVGTLPAAPDEGKALEVAAVTSAAAATAAVGPEKASFAEAEVPEPESSVAEAPAPPPQPHRGSIAMNATPSGLTAVKCPACQAENSSYRSECFNCGASLR